MTVRTHLVLACALLLVSRQAVAQRLPATASPEHYDLTFDIDLANARFSGTTGIDVRLRQPATRITLHALELTIKSATIAAGGQSQTATVALDAEAQTATLTVPRQLPAGPARIEIAYDAPLNDKLRGLYLSKGANRSYAVTQLESTDARRAFPCFDEPAFKATFTVTVVADRGDVAISNGRMLSDTPGPAAKHTMTFSTTAKMSSYLVAIAVGDFQCLEGGADGVPIRICATPDKKELGHLALESAQQNLTFLNRYHTIKYPFGKLDVVAVPDFAAGAMENTGAIFYRETDLLADAKTASLRTRKNIVSILAHEMAHQWFGDLVTMAWWDDLWLNESFATWMAPNPAASSKPEWHMEIDEAAENQTELSLDSLKTTHPIHVTVSTPSEIESVFDPISYEKGAAVLRMIESYVGADAFRKGVNAYIETHASANATSEDFFAALTSSSGKPVDRVMGTFVMQPGVPQLDVAASCVDGRNTVTLTQRRFFLDPANARDGREQWQIPVCLETPGAASPTCVLLTEPSKTVPIGSSCAPWVFANAGGKGYYRTAYAPEAIKALSRDLESSLSAAERLSLISDEWALVRAAKHSAASYLDLVAGLGRETSAEVLGSAADRLGFIDEYLTSAANRPAFRQFVRALLAPTYQTVGFDRKPDDSEERRSLRAVVVAILGGIAEDQDVVRRSRTAVDAALAGSAPLDPIAATTLVNTAAANGDAALFDRLLQAAGTAVSPEDHYRYLFALTSFRDAALAAKALDYALSPNLRSQDTAIYLAGFFANDAIRDRAWTFVKAHWTELEPKVTISLGDINLANSLAQFCSAGARDDIRTFFAAHPLPAAGRALQQTFERIDNCIDTRQRQQPALDTWLSSTRATR
jgi:aminopeptidase N